MLSPSSGRRRLRVRGTVQGVGFRPFVHRLAHELGLSGFVGNDTDGVFVEAEGEAAALDAFERRLQTDAPPLAVVATVASHAVAPVGGEGFTIVGSDCGGVPDAPVAVDSATCAACLAEVDDPADRRYRYPFTNCTGCGPRYTIVRRIPYDRPATTMAGFTMCPACQAEYDDPADRRFHAQPNACPLCGPTLRFGNLAGDAALEAAVVAVCQGAILAVKGIGGFHLAADATSDEVVARLRARKHRDDKPFAVMVASAAAAEALATFDEAGIAALTSPRRPIVIAPRRADPATRIAEAVAPGLPDLGLMLPYTPLHHLLLAGAGRPLVMTSANLSDEPIAHTDQDALSRLGSLVDGFLTHDRPIHVRCDDSVVQAPGTGRVQALRRSRGHAPAPIRLPVPAPAPVLAVGAELKSTVAVARGEWVTASHHIGDLEHLPAWQSFTQAVEHVCHLHGVAPAVVAHDLHPEYLSSKWAADLDGVTLVGVQHHHAHVASCLVEHGRTGPVTGLAFDGLGYGADGTWWGGEVLVASLTGCERVASLTAVPMPGGAAAIREPWRMAVAWASDPEAMAARFDDPRGAAVVGLLGRAPVTSSMGRLFDAVAAVLGVRTRVTYEGQAAVELEALARAHGPAPAAYPFPSLDGHPLFDAVVADLDAGTDEAAIAARFHASVAAGAVEAALAPGLPAVALTGGVFQNVVLAEAVAAGVRAAGIEVLLHERIPANDGGISIGQAAIAAASAAHGRRNAWIVGPGWAAPPPSVGPGGV